MIYFLRHGESQANADHVFAGQRDDSPLTDNGIAQAHQAADDIKQKGLILDRLVCSPLQRSKRTATTIAHDLDLPAAKITIDPRITEYDMGSLTGTSMDKTSAELIAPDDAEAVEEFQHRVMTALHEYTALPGNTLIVSHAAVAKIIEATRLHHQPHLFYDLDGYPHGEIVALKFLSA